MACILFICNSFSLLQDNTDGRFIKCREENLSIIVDYWYFCYKVLLWTVIKIWWNKRVVNDYLVKNNFYYFENSQSSWSFLHISVTWLSNLSKNSMSVLTTSKVTLFSQLISVLVILKDVILSVSLAFFPRHMAWNLSE